MDAKKSLEIRHSSISGNGTFAKENILKGSYITSLTGTPFNKLKIDAICEEHHLANDDPLQIDENTMLVLDYASKTINHSCEPSAGMRGQNDLYALVDIQVGDEITYDYSTTVGIEDTAWRMPCQCGSKLCREKIGNVLTIPAAVIHRYTELNALPDFIIDELKQAKSANF